MAESTTKVGSGRTPGSPAACQPAVAGRSGWSARVGKALCWGGPGLALAILGSVALGGGGLLMGAAAAVIPFVAALACPLVMYLMMRSMSGMGPSDGRKERDPR